MWPDTILLTSESQCNLFHYSIIIWFLSQLQQPSLWNLCPKALPTVVPAVPTLFSPFAPDSPSPHFPQGKIH